MGYFSYIEQTILNKGIMPARLLAVYFSVVLLFAAFIPADDIQRILSKLEKFKKRFPQEKVYLHLDKPYYAITDTIYFKAYVVNAERNAPSAISNVLYVDVIDEKDKIRHTGLRPITDGTSWGTIALADSLTEGRYRIRAYTTWMRNFDAAFFWDRSITVGSSFDNEITASAIYKGRFTGDGKDDSVLIQYKSIGERRLAGHEVTYSIKIDEKEVLKGKSTISEKGNFQLSLAGLPGRHSQQAEITTRIKTDNKRTITKTIDLALPVAAYGVQFFPEGGQMLNETPAVVGFKAVNADGTGADVSGEIKDENGTVQTAFQSHVAGMGSFAFTPQAGHTYYAFTRHKNGTAQKIELPKAMSAGYVLAVNNSDTANITIKVTAKDAKPLNYVTLIAQSNNRTYHTAQLDLIDGTATAFVSKKKFLTGIIQFTLFNEAALPVAERLVFINHQDQLRINMQLNKAAYSVKEKVQMELTVKDETGNPVSGHFSIAVTDENTVDSEKAKERGILSHLLLTSDLKGHIENPEYYFTDADEAKEKALDNLMLTQGWSRFVWADILADKYPEAPFRAEKDLAISGTVLSRKGVPVAGAKVTLLSKKGIGYMLDTLTGRDGRFAFGELEFSDDKPFVVQAQSPGGNDDVYVKLNEFRPAPVTPHQNLFYPSATYSVIQPYLIQSARRYEEMKKRGWIAEKGKVLQTVTVTAQRQSKVQEAVAPSANLNGPGNADQIFTYEDLQKCSDLQCLAGRILGVTFKLVLVGEPDSRAKVPRMQAFSTRGMGKPMVVILDGVEIGIFESDIRSIPAANVQSIEVLRSGAYLSVYGTRASGGVLVITTKRGGIDYNAGLNTSASNSAQQNTVFTTAKGYSVVRRFYVPDYSRPQEGSTMPDLRSTIYWQPDVVTGDDGKAVVSFYNADAAARYNVIIEGFTAKGQLGRAFYSYEVK